MIGNMDIGKIAKVIGIPIEKWRGNCHGVASLLLQHGLVIGKLRYGHWTGPVSEKSIFGKYPRGLVRHGWIELKDGTIVDPTRFEFEHKQPYIYVGNNDYYDAGGNKIKLVNLKPAPEYNPSEKQVIISITYPSAMELVKELLKMKMKTKAKSEKLTITLMQAFWIANLPLQLFEGLAKPIYQALIDAELGAFIPIDNKNIVME